MDFPHERLRRAITETSQSSPAHETWGAVSSCKLRYVKRAEEMLYVLVPDTFVLVAMPYYAGTCTSRNSVERTQGPHLCSSLQKTELSYYIRNTNCIGSFKICLLFLTNYVHYKRVSNKITRSYN